MKLVKILPLFAAAGMVLAGCDSRAVAETGGSAAPVETSPDGTDSTGAGGDDAAVTDDPAAVKKISVRFEVLNGGLGLWKTWGIAAAGDSDYSVRSGARFANDFTITITVPAAVDYLNISFKSQDVAGVKGYLDAALDIKDAGKYTIGIDFNLKNLDVPSFSTKNLRNVWWYFPENGDAEHLCEKWWNELWNKAVDN